MLQRAKVCKVKKVEFPGKDQSSAFPTNVTCSFLVRDEKMLLTCKSKEKPFSHIIWLQTNLWFSYPNKRSLNNYKRGEFD